MNILVKTGLSLLCLSALSCSAGTAGKAEQRKSQPEQKPNIEQQEGTLKIYALDVAIGGKTWSQEGVYIEQAELLKMNEEGPFPLVVILKGPPIDGKTEADLRFWFSIPGDYDGNPIHRDLAKKETDEYVISFSDDNEAYTTWVAPWIATYDHVNHTAINEPQTSGSVTLESFDQSSKRLRITFDGVLFGASSDTTTHSKTAKGTVDLEFSVFDLQVETEKMMREWGL